MSGRENISRRLEEKNLSPNKRFGQNFLTDESVTDRIIAAADITKDDTVLEIGPGAGALTKKLADLAGRLVAVEIDRGLATMLTEDLSDRENTEIICGDIVKTDLSALFPKSGVKVVANLPYYITTPILLELIPKTDMFSRFVVMMQKEVADRMGAAPGSKDYGALSLIVQYYCTTEVVAIVPPSAFYPRPDVTSAVLKLDRPDSVPVSTDDPGKMFRLIRAAFGKRRKTLVNAVSTSMPGISAEDIKTALDTMGLDRSVRGEALSLEDYARLSDLLTRVGQE